METEKRTHHGINPQTRIGHVHLKVANIERALGFYRDILGFEVTQWYGEDAVFLSAGGYHHHIGLNTWMSRDAPPARRYSSGLSARTAVAWAAASESVSRESSLRLSMSSQARW